MKNLSSESIVYELIKGNSKCLKVDAVRKTFNEEEVDIICNIPINKRGSEDKIIWDYNKSEKFTVKSAYYVALMRKGEAQGESSKQNYVDDGWIKMWKMNVPSKVKTL